jgi:hypothetical protein
VGVGSSWGAASRGAGEVTEAGWQARARRGRRGVWGGSGTGSEDSVGEILARSGALNNGGLARRVEEGGGRERAGICRRRMGGMGDSLRLQFTCPEHTARDFVAATKTTYHFSSQK